MHVLFVAPHFPSYQRHFVRAMHSVGAKVTGIGEASLAHLDSELKSWMVGYEQVPSVCDEQAMLDAVRRVQRRSYVDRLETTIEAHILPTAAVREATGIPGLSVKAAVLCRDKPQMKEHLRAHGIPCAASDGIDSIDAAVAFVRQHGYPVIIKPRAGAGASGTSRCDNDGQLAAALKEAGVDRGHSVAIEEFIEGHEGFYDTMSVNGEPVMEFVSHYYPNVLDAMRNRWISPYIVSTNRLDASGYDALKELGRKVITTMGLGTTATHMEWFYGPKGLKFSEIGARPPGVGQWDVYAAGNDIDIYREWANAIVHGRIERRPSRRFASGIIALRPDRDGRIVGYEGVEEVQRRFGEYVTKAHLPPAGTPTQGIEAGYMANAWIQMRHPDYDTMREIFEVIGRTIRVRAG
jgi:formate-dependent phosphoribosylglycinamide formyltransferase (GAR transformylase)